jgi:hypothetical protein
MASPTLSYVSPSDAHSTIGSPAPSQILLKRVASPNHLGQPQYVESPRSVPLEYSHYHTPNESQFEYSEQEVYVNEDPHVYDFPNGVPVDQQYVPSHGPQHPNPTNNMLFAVLSYLVCLTLVPRRSNTATHADERTVRRAHEYRVGAPYVQLLGRT